MADFEFAPDVDGDLEDIARYTIKKWGEAQAMHYAAALDSHFAKIGEGSLQTRSPIKHRPELCSSRCQKHVVFHLDRDGECPLILAVLHQNMDLIERLKDRL